MASDKSFIEFIVDQISDVGQIPYKKMFGEYALYCEGKVDTISPIIWLFHC